MVADHLLTRRRQLQSLISSTFSEAKWNEANEWSHSPISRKKYRPVRTAPRSGRGPKQEETGIPLLPVEDGARAHRRIPALGHQTPTNRTVLVRTTQHQANPRSLQEVPSMEGTAETLWTAVREATKRGKDRFKISGTLWCSKAVRDFRERMWKRKMKGTTLHKFSQGSGWGGVDSGGSMPRLD